MNLHKNETGRTDKLKGTAGLFTQGSDSKRSGGVLSEEGIKMFSTQWPQPQTDKC